MKYLKQSTAVNVPIGPFLDNSDGITEETGLTISQADVRLTKNGGNIAQKNESSACTHDEIGYYTCPLDDTDTNTLGNMTLIVHESGAIPYREDFMVVPANVYDSLFGSDKLQVDAVEVSSDSTAADDLELFIEALGTDNKTLISTDAQDLSGSLDVNTKTFETGLDLTATMKTSIGTEAATALTNYDAPTNTEMEARTLAAAAYATAANQTTIITDTNELQTDLTNGGRIDLLIDAIKAKTDNLPTDPADASDIAAAFEALNAPTAETIADAVWDEAISGHEGAGTFGAKNQKVVPSETVGDYKADVSALATAANLQTVDDNVDAILTDTGTTIPGLIAALNDLSAADVNAEVDTALTDYDPPTKTEMDAGHALLATAANLATVDGIVDTILVDTNEIQGKLPTNYLMGSSDQADHDGELASPFFTAAQTELSAIPSTTGTLQQFIQFLHSYFRNKAAQTNSTFTLYKEDASTSLGSASVSDNGTTATRGELG